MFPALVASFVHSVETVGTFTADAAKTTFLLSIVTVEL